MDYILPYSPIKINIKQRIIKKNKKIIIKGKRTINLKKDNSFDKVKRNHRSFLQIPVLDF